MGDYIKHPKHAKFHELVGLAVAILSVILLVAYGFDNPGRWNQVLFNISLLAVAFYWPFKDYFRWHQEPMAELYWVFLLAASMLVSLLLVGAGVEDSLSQAFFNPATMNFIAGWFLVWTHSGYMRAESALGKLAWVGMMTVAAFTIIYLFAPHMPGEVGNAAMNVRNTMDATVIPLLNSAGGLIWQCTTTEEVIPQDDPIPGLVETEDLPPAGDPEACMQRIETFADNVQQFFLSIPGGEYLWQAAVYVTDRAFTYVNGMACIGGKGGLSGIAYENDASTEQSDDSSSPLPHQDVRGCFVSDDGSDTSGTDSDGPDSSISMQSLEVSERPSGAEAAISFSGDYPQASQSDFSASGPGGGLTVTSVFKRGSGTVVVTTDKSGLSSGDDVTVTWSGVGSCSDAYADGSSSSCGTGAGGLR